MPIIPKGIIDQFVTGRHLTMGSNSAGTDNAEECWAPVDGDTIQARFETWVRLQPDHPALISQAASFSYAELNCLANRIAHALLAADFDRLLPVGIVMDQNELQVATTLGVLKAGGFYVALDPRNPIERNRLIMMQSGCPLVLTNEARRLQVWSTPDHSIRCIEIDQLEAGLVDTNPAVAIHPQALACLIYTSGSTGRPKGVMHSHETVLHNMERHGREFDIHPRERQSLIYSPSVYGGHRDAFNALLNGASLHLYPLLVQGITDLPSWLRNEQITIFCCVATVFRQFLRQLEPGTSFPDLRLIKLGGERSFAQDIKECRQRLHGGWRIHCGYGSSEVGLLCSFFVDDTTELGGEIVPLGYALGEPALELLDDDGNASESGEIVVRSRYITLGYWRDEDTTARVMQIDPDDHSRRIFRTGDLATRDADGCLRLTGRADFQVKINGNRVQIDEVEAAVKHIPAVQDAVVIARHDTKRGDTLEACLVVRPGFQQPSVRDLRSAISATLPAFMVPAAYRWLDALPQLPSGKVDRRRLSESVFALPVSTAVPARATATRTEREVIRIWCDVLGRTGIGLDDDFFELGGDSMRGMMMVAGVAREFGVQMPLVTLLRSSQARTFAAAIDVAGKNRRFATLVPFRTHGQRAPFFCVHGVFGGVLFLRELVDRLDTDQPVYAFQPPNLDGSRFRFASLSELADHYIDEMKTVQPEGPYSIGGFSFGGKVVYEMACRLRARGEHVRRLVIFDSGPPLRKHADIDPDEGLAESGVGPTLREHLRRVRRVAGRGGRPTSLWLVSLFESLMDGLRPRIQHQRLRFGGRLDVVDRDGYLSWNHRRLLDRQLAERYAGDLVVFAGDGRTARLQQGWSDWVDGHLLVLTVPGNHREIFWSPNVDVLARKLERCLADEEMS